MGMAKKKEDKHDSGTITVNKEEFKQTRDTFLSSFVVLQDAIRDLTSNYIKHTNTVLGDSGSNIDSVLKDLGEVAGNAAAAAARSASPIKNDLEKKERKKRVHDTNAPKRPLTPYFLYMQTARAIITHDLGPGVAKGAVSEEGTRRWSSMGKDDRDSWTRAYQDNLKLYHAKTHSYKAGNLTAKSMTDDEARIYYEDHLAGTGDHAADAQLVNEALANDLDLDTEGSGEADIDADGEADSEEEIAAPVVKSPTPPPKTPKVKSSRKKTLKTEMPIAPPTPATVATFQAAPEPDKKRKRKTKAELDKERASAADAPVDSIEREELLVQTPAASKSSKPKKKKTKSDA